MRTDVPVLFGVDLVEVDRVSRALSYSGDTYDKHVTSPAEHDLHADRVLAVSAAVAIKECLVKAIGGRAPGFTWHDFEACATADFPEHDWAESVLHEVATPVEESTNIKLSGMSSYSVSGASKAAALTRLAVRDDTRPLSAVARWGCNGELLVAVALLATGKEALSP